MVERKVSSILTFVLTRRVDCSWRRGFPMSVFAVVAVGGGGLGPIVAGWVEINPRLEWRWIQWYQMM